MIMNIRTFDFYDMGQQFIFIYLFFIRPTRLRFFYLFIYLFWLVEWEIGINPNWHLAVGGGGRIMQVFVKIIPNGPIGPFMWPPPFSSLFKQRIILSQFSLSFFFGLTSKVKLHLCPPSSFFLFIYFLQFAKN